MTLRSARPPMTTMRGTLVSQMCAVLFVVLIVLPFTAPFRTCDFGTPLGRPWHQDLKASEDLSNSTGIAERTPSSGPVISGVIVRGPTGDRLAPHPRARQIVLRL